MDGRGGFQDLLVELKRRRVFRAVVGYGFVSFALLQVIEPVMHGLRLPDQTLTWLVLLLGAGFPVVVVLAWIFDVSGAPAARGPDAATVRYSPRLILTLVGLGLLAASPGVLWSLTRRAPAAGAPAASAGPSVAVLPFADLSPQKDQEFFSDGIAEEILNSLTHIEGLHVAGRTSAFSFKGKNEDARVVGQQLNVGTVLEGSVRKDGKRVRITTQLINAADGYQLWSETFDRELTAVFAVEDEIADAVVRALKVRLLPGRGPATREHRTASAEAYSDFLLGHQFFNRNSGDGFQHAREAYQRAVELDPGYAAAWAALAQTSLALADFNTSAEGVVRDRQRAHEAAAKAVALDPDLADVYVQRASVRQVVDFDWEGARQDLERALTLNPGDALTRQEYGELLAALGRLPEAIRELRKASELDPISSRVWNALARIYDASGEIELARSAVLRSMEIAPDSFSGPYHLATTYLLQQQPALALRQLESFKAEGNKLCVIAMAEHDLGHLPESRRALDSGVARFGHVLAFQLAEAFAWIGEPDHAFEWLDRAYAQHDGGLTMVKYSPLLRSLRGDARYAALLRRLKLPPG